ncbi:MAG TPA: hypothetical protein VEQ60_08420 [Longimicrobium sp.]|nr:hypothetical protein [Longimicrobium sp.]
MARRNSLLALFLGTLACAAAYASAFLPGDPPGWSPWALGIGTATVMVAASALGAARADTGIGRLKLPFAIAFLIVAGGFAAVLSIPAPDAANPTLFLGLPAGAAIVILGIGLLPLLVLPIAYALTFEDMTLSEADLARVREAARAWQAAQQPAAAPSVHAQTPEPAEVVA